MATVVADMSVSLDGFVADPADSVEHVFAWYGEPQPRTQPTEPRADDPAPSLRVIVYGRRTFELARGWGGAHPTGRTVIVVTHRLPEGWPQPGSSVSFVTLGFKLAMERAAAVAGPGVVALGSPSVIQQGLNLGLVDRIQVKMVPVLLGTGIRLFDNLTSGPIKLEGPVVTEGNAVTHLTYHVSGRRAYEH